MSSKIKIIAAAILILIAAGTVFGGTFYYLRKAGKQLPAALVPSAEKAKKASDTAAVLNTAGLSEPTGNINDLIQDLNNDLARENNFIESENEAIDVDSQLLNNLESVYVENEF